MTIRVTTDHVERGHKLQEWIATLHAVGGYVEPLADIQAHLQRARDLQRLRIEASASEHALTRDALVVGLIQAPELPALVDVVSDARAIATESMLITDARNAVRLANAPVAKPFGARIVEEVLDILDTAAQGAADLAWRLFSRRGDDNLDLVRDAYAAHAQSLIATVERIPEHIESLESAARSGNSDAWLVGESHYAAIFRIRDLVEDWHVDDIVPKVKRHDQYGVDAYFYADPASAYEATGMRPQNSSRVKRSFRAEATALAAGGAVIRTATEITSPHEQTPAQDDSPQGRVWDGSERRGRRPEPLTMGRIFQD